MKVVYRIDDVELTKSEMREFSRKTQRALQEVLDTYAFEIQRMAQQLAPVDTGFLRSNIYVQDDGEWTRLVISGADYSAYVEFGTRTMQAQPFLVPAAEHFRRPFEQAVRDVINGNVPRRWR